jgi:hypothetical protein
MRDTVNVAKLSSFYLLKAPGDRLGRPGAFTTNRVCNATTARIPFLCSYAIAVRQARPPV